MSIDKDFLDRLMEGCAPDDLFGKGGVLPELTKALAERALNVEMNGHLSEEHAEEFSEGRNQPANRCNGNSQKTVTADTGKVVLEIPHDRNRTFDPLLIGKYQHRFLEFDRLRVGPQAGKRPGLGRIRGEGEGHRHSCR